jgi:hypothetical protein
MITLRVIIKEANLVEERFAFWLRYLEP